MAGLEARDEGAVRLVNTGDVHDKYTPLILAAKNGHVECCQMLCLLGKADVDLKAGWNETTALMKAAEKGHENVIATLIELGADVNLRNSFGNTALMLGAEFGKEGVVRVLTDHIKEGRLVTELDFENEYKYTALIFAAENGNKQCADSLISRGADPNKRNMFGKTALIMAAEFGQQGVVEALCAAGAGLDVVSQRGLSAIMLAAVKGHVEAVACLTRYGADIHSQTADKTDNALTMACLGGKTVVVKDLIREGGVLPDNASIETVLMVGRCVAVVRWWVDWVVDVVARSPSHGLFPVLSVVLSAVVAAAAATTTTTTTIIAAIIILLLSIPLHTLSLVHLVESMRDGQQRGRGDPPRSLRQWQRGPGLSDRSE